MEDRVIASFGTVSADMCPELFLALKHISEKVNLGPSPMVVTNMPWKHCKESTNIPYWFLTHAMCLAGANIESVIPADNNLDESCRYKVVLKGEDSLEAFCERLEKMVPFCMRTAEDIGDFCERI